MRSLGVYNNPGIERTSITSSEFLGNQIESMKIEKVKFEIPPLYMEKGKTKSELK